MLVDDGFGSKVFGSNVRPNYSLGFAVGSPPLVWTVSLRPEEAAKKYLDFKRKDDRTIKTMADTGEGIRPVIISSYDPNNPLDDKALTIFLQGYRQALRDTNQLL